MRLSNAAACLGLTLSVLPFAALADGSPLPGDAIKRLVSGKNVFLSVPLGGEFPLRYNSNGVVEGNGEATGLGKFMAPKDAGKWWITENRLCQQWKSWYDGKPFCFTISQTGPNAIQWKRDDGYSGTARITN